MQWAIQLNIDLGDFPSDHSLLFEQDGVALSIMNDLINHNGVWRAAPWKACGSAKDFKNWFGHNLSRCQRETLIADFKVRVQLKSTEKE